MTMKRRTFIELLPAVAAAPLALAAHAQDYPTHPVTVLVGGAAGSVPDLLARSLAERLALRLGQPVLVENKPGAGGSIAMATLARSSPDGHTLALATMSQAVFNSYLFEKLPYDPIRDLEPVAPLVTGAMVLAAHPSFPAQTLAEFVSQAKAKPGALFIGMPQLGSPPHVVALLLNRAAGIDVKMVPHKSGADAMNAALSGEIPLIIEAPTTIAPQVQAGKLKALAVTGRQREPLLPGTPTLMESGLALHGEAWIGLVAPARTPAPVAERLNRELRSVMDAPEMRAVMARMSFRVMSGTPDEFRRLIAEEHAKWGPAIRDAGLKLQ
jgi:tripartite-type tricarboxylate transporter receptor subunit TctC